MKKVIIPILAIMTLAACNKSEVVPAAQENGKAIRFTSNLPTYTITKAASVLDGKTVKIFAGAPINAVTTAEADDSKLTPATTLYWLKDQTDLTTFASVYPADMTESTTFTYNLSNGDLAYHGAVLAATEKDVEPEDVVNFEYKHPFAMLKIAVTNNLEGTPDIAGVSVGSTAGSATMDIAAGTVSNLGENAIIATTLSDGKYCVVIFPQSAKPVINVTVDPSNPKTYKFIITSSVEFAANKFYDVALTLDESTPPVVVGEEVEFGFSVADWEAAEEEIPVLDVTEKWTLIGLGDWGTDVDMTLENGLWTVSGIAYQAGDEFKLRKALDWAVSAGLKEGVSYVGDDIWDGYLEANSNSNIKLAAAGIYTLSFNPETYQFTATKTGDVEPVDPTPVVWKVRGLGDDWSWDNGVEMTENEGVWECDITYAEGDSFKLCNGDDAGAVWAGLQSGWTYYGTGAFDDGYLSTDGGAANIVVGAEGGIAGNYHLSFNPSTLRFIITVIVPEP